MSQENYQLEKISPLELAEQKLERIRQRKVIAQLEVERLEALLREKSEEKTIKTVAEVPEEEPIFEMDMEDFLPEASESLDQGENQSRRKFLKTAGWLAVGTAAAGLGGLGLNELLKKPAVREPNTPAEGIKEAPHILEGQKEFGKLLEYMDIKLYRDLPEPGKLFYLERALGLEKHTETIGIVVIVDKEKNMLYVLDGTNKPVVSTPIIRGKESGDALTNDEAYRSPASYSPFEPNDDPDYAKIYGQHTYHIDIKTPNGRDQRVFMHELLGNDREGQIAVLRSIDPRKRDKSNGCIRIENIEQYKQYFDPKKTKSAAEQKEKMVYPWVAILPYEKTPGKVHVIDRKTREIKVVSRDEFEETQAKIVQQGY